jgi:hypothetical protein
MIDIIFIRPINKSFSVILVPDLVRDKLRRGIQKVLKSTGSPGQTGG